MGVEREDDDSSVTPIDALSHPLRRRLIEYLLQARDNGQGMVFVANEVARFKAEGGYDSADEVTPQKARSDLQEQHIPELERAGILTYDAEEDTLALADSPITIRSYLEDVGNTSEGTDL